MAQEDVGRPARGWRDRVSFTPGGVAYRPAELLVRGGVADLAEQELRSLGRERDGKSAPELRREETLGGRFVRFRGVPDLDAAFTGLRRAGVAAQFNHVLFATGCCPPHPSTPAGKALAANPFYASGVSANPFYASPFYASSTGAGGCCCACSGSVAGNPFYASPFYASPFYASADPNPALVPALQATGRRRSSARPATAPPTPAAAGAEVTGIRIAVLDTGWAQSHAPTGLPGLAVHDHGGDRPDEDGDRFLDPAAGHGTFIAGVIEQAAPGCALELFAPLGSMGDGSEHEIGTILVELAERPDDQRPHLVNLSFGGYAPLGMDALAVAVGALVDAGTIVVASAGNDATCVPMYPAALDGVIGVGAIDDDGDPAPFTNYGPWVRACAPGVDVTSIFFEDFDGGEPSVAGADPDAFAGWATWSGTSFAAPRVVGALARHAGGPDGLADAVEQLIAGAGLERHPMLGVTVR